MNVKLFIKLSQLLQWDTLHRDFAILKITA